MKICVLNSPDGWHVQDLIRAAAGRHVVDAIRFEALVAEIDGGRPKPLRSGEHPLEAYDCVFTRAMPAGTLEQIVLRMDILLEIQRRGVPIVNPPRAIEASVDKYLSLTKLAAEGIPVPRTAVSQSVSQALAQFERFGRDVVVKPLFGSMGRGLVRVAGLSSAEQEFAARIEHRGVVYQQEFIAHGGFDLRLLVIGNRVLGMKRTNRDSWITNISQGGIGTAHSPTASEQQLALRSTAAVGAMIAGVDLAYDQRTGEPFVLEVNSAPSWKAIAGVLDTDIAAMMIEFLAAHSTPAIQWGVSR